MRELAQDKPAADCSALGKQFVPVFSAFPEYLFQLDHGLRIGVRKLIDQYGYRLIYLRNVSMHF